MYSGYFVSDSLRHPWTELPNIGLPLVSDSIDTKSLIHSSEFILNHFPFHTRLGGVMLITALKIETIQLIVGAIVSNIVNNRPHVDDGYDLLIFVTSYLYQCYTAGHSDQ